MPAPSSEHRSQRRRSFWLWLTAWAVLTVLVVVAARAVAWGEALAALSGARWPWLALAMVANFLFLPLGAAEWQVFLPRGRKVGRWTMFWITAVTSTVSNTGPFLTGHAAGIHLLATRGGLGYAPALSVKWLDQIATGLAKIVMLGMVLLLAPLPAGWRATTFTLLVGVPALVAGAVVAAHRGHVLERMAERRGGLVGRVLDFVGRSATHLDAIKRPRHFWTGVALSFLRRVLEGVAIWAVTQAVGLELPFWGLILVLTAVNLSTMASLTPANLGIYEGSAVVAYGLAGVDLDVAVGVAVLQHLVYLVPLAGPGWVLLALDRVPLRSVMGAAGAGAASGDAKGGRDPAP